MGPPAATRGASKPAQGASPQAFAQTPFPAGPCCASSLCCKFSDVLTQVAFQAQSRRREISPTGSAMCLLLSQLVRVMPARASTLSIRFFIAHLLRQTQHTPRSVSPRKTPGLSSLSPLNPQQAAPENATVLISTLTRCISPEGGTGGRPEDFKSHQVVAACAQSAESATRRECQSQGSCQPSAARRSILPFRKNTRA